MHRLVLDQFSCKENLTIPQYSAHSLNSFWLFERFITSIFIRQITNKNYLINMKYEIVHFTGKNNTPPPNVKILATPPNKNKCIWKKCETFIATFFHRQMLCPLFDKKHSHFKITTSVNVRWWYKNQMLKLSITSVLHSWKVSHVFLSKY